jgi:hypothetical protein
LLYADLSTTERTTSKIENYEALVQSIVLRNTIRMDGDHIFVSTVSTFSPLIVASWSGKLRALGVVTEIGAFGWANYKVFRKQQIQIADLRNTLAKFESRGTDLQIIAEPHSHYFVSTALFQSGVAVRNGEMAAQLQAGAQSFTVPYGNDPADGAEAEITNDDRTRVAIDSICTLAVAVRAPILVAEHVGEAQRILRNLGSVSANQRSSAGYLRSSCDVNEMTDCSVISLTI